MTREFVMEDADLMYKALVKIAFDSSVKTKEQMSNVAANAINKIIQNVIDRVPVRG